MPRLSVLDAVYSDFVHTAVTYGRTIISEYFLHEYMKSIRWAQEWFHVSTASPVVYL